MGDSMKGKDSQDLMKEEGNREDEGNLEEG